MEDAHSLFALNVLECLIHVKAHMNTPSGIEWERSHFCDKRSMPDKLLNKYIRFTCSFIPDNEL